MRGAKLNVLLLAAALLLPGASRAVEEKVQAIKVVAGDTLWSISQKYLKDPKRWNVILKFNSLPTSDPTVALPGMTLKIPTEELKEKYQAAVLLDMERAGIKVDANDLRARVELPILGVVTRLVTEADRARARVDLVRFAAGAGGLFAMFAVALTVLAVQLSRQVV